MSKNVLADTLLALSGAENSVVVVHKAFVKFTGSIEAAIMMSQLLYWTTRSTRNGWIAKTDSDFAEELCLTVYAVRQSRGRLEQMGFLETDLRKFNGTPTMHYHLDLQKLEELWIQKVDFANSQSGLCENDKSLTETTAETTAEKEIAEKPQPEVRQPRTAEDIRKMTMEALVTGMQAHEERKAAGIGEAGHYPAAVMDVIGKVCQLWRLTPPGRTDGRYTYWIKAANDLRAACGEFGLDLLDDLHTFWLENEYTVSGPGSLINTAAALAGKKRSYVVVTRPLVPTGYHWDSSLTAEQNKQMIQEMYKQMTEETRDETDQDDES